MKQIFENKIINIDNSLDNRFLFRIAKSAYSDFEVNMSDLLLPFKNDSLDYSKDYKLWNEVFSPKKELEIFNDILEENLKKNKKIHISNISLLEEVSLVRELYLDLGYFNKEFNRFDVDMKNAPITIGVSLNNLIYSFKDYNLMKEKIFFIPPPREPRHQKSLKSAVNSSVISTIRGTGSEDELNFLKHIIMDEKINLLKLARSLYYNYINIGFKIDFSEIIIDLDGLQH